MNIYELTLMLENLILLLIVIYHLIINTRKSHHNETQDIIEKAELEQKKKLRARELFANGYLPLRYKNGYFICSSLYPDGSEPGGLIEYKFPLESSEGDGLTVHIKSKSEE